MTFKHALKWSFLSELASKAIQPFVFVVLARLLTPEDYGVVAAATMVISFSQIFWEAGMGKAIIQYQGDRVAAANAAFWINNVLGVVVSLLLLLISGVVADRVFHDPRVAIVLNVMALQVFLSAIVSVHTALLQKDMHFRHLFWVRLATVAIPGLVSIPLAMYGMGYWSLVAGTLAGQMIQVVMLWKTSAWKPRFSFDVAIARQLVRFGGWVAATGLLAWFYLWADSLIVGMYLGSHELGLYRTGNAFVLMIYGFVFGPILPVLYSHFSCIQHDEAKVKNLLSEVMDKTISISIPVAFVLIGLSSFVSTYMLGDKWWGVERVISIVSIMQAIAWVYGAHPEAYRALGKPRVETYVMGASIFIFLPIYLIAITKGLEVFMYARLACILIVGVFVHQYASLKILNLRGVCSLKEYFGLVVLLLMTIVIQRLAGGYQHGWIANVVMSFGCSILFVWMKRKTLVDLLNDVVWSKVR